MPRVKRSPRGFSRTTCAAVHSVAWRLHSGENSPERNCHPSADIFPRTNANIRHNIRENSGRAPAHSQSLSTIPRPTHNSCPHNSPLAQMVSKRHEREGNKQKQNDADGTPRRTQCPSPYLNEFVLGPRRCGPRFSFRSLEGGDRLPNLALRDECCHESGPN